MGLLDAAVPASSLPVFGKFLVYGSDGVGKTTWSARNAPDPIFLDFERSTETLRNTPDLTHIPVISIKGKAIVNAPKITDEFIASSKYKTIIIDSMSAGQDKQLRAHMDARFAKKMEDQDRYLPLWYDFRLSTEIFKEVFMKLQDSDKNVIIVAHAREFWKKDKEGNSNLVAIRPDITPRLSDSLRRLLNVVTYVELERSELRNESTRKFYFNPTYTIASKNRLNIQETYIENPTWKELINE